MFAHLAQKVVPMSDIVTPACSAAPCANPAGPQSAIDRVCAYWGSLPRDGLAPDRAALDASMMAHALPDVFIAELVTPRVARLRLVGHRVEDLMEMEVRGMPLTALFTGPARDVLTDAVEQVGRGARVLLPVEGERGFGLPTMTGQLALLPLCDGTGAITRVLGVLEIQGSIGRKPRRLNVTTSAPLALPALQEMPRPVAHSAPIFRVIKGGKQ